MTILVGREVLRERLLAELPRTVEVILRAVAAEVPAYRALAPAQVQEVAAIAGWGATRVIDLWAEGGRLGADDLARFRGIGAARAADGRPLPVILRAYRVAGQAAIDVFMEIAGEAVTARDVLDMTRLWLASIDELSEAIYAGYQVGAQRLQDRDQALADLFADLLIGRQVRPAALADRCRELGLSLPTPMLLLVVCTPERSAPASGVLAELAEGQALLHGLQDGVGVLVAPAAARGRLVSDLAGRGLLGCGLVRTQPGELAQAFRWAREALRSAPERAFAGASGAAGSATAGSATAVLGEGDVQVIALLRGGAESSPEAVAAAVLGDVVRSEVLLETLDAVLLNGSAPAAARHLGVHPQTVRYRLRRITELTGRDRGRPWDRFVLDLARTLTPRRDDALESHSRPRRKATT